MFKVNECGANVDPAPTLNLWKKPERSIHKLCKSFPELWASIYQAGGRLTTRSHEVSNVRDYALGFSIVLKFDGHLGHNAKCQSDTIIITFNFAASILHDIWRMEWVEAQRAVTIWYIPVKVTLNSNFTKYRLCISDVTQLNWCTPNFTRFWKISTFILCCQSHVYLWPGDVMV